MSKMTFKFTTSFDTTVVVDLAFMREQLSDLRKAQAATGFNKLPVKNQVFTKLVLQAADRSEEEGIAELLRFNIRTGMNEHLNDAVAHTSAEVTLRPSPSKVVCHGIEI